MIVFALTLWALNVSLDWFMPEHRVWLEVTSVALFAINMRLFLTMPNPPGGLAQHNDPFR